MPIPNDTHPDAETAQIRRLREMTNQERSVLLISLTDSAIYHAKRAIARANPELTERECNFLFMEINYGRELAEAVRADWKARNE